MPTHNRIRILGCGHTIKHALHDQNMSFRDVDAVYISHVHGDHVFGLERLAYEALFKYKKRVKLFFHESLQQELWDQTLKGSLGRIGEGPACFDDFFDLHPLSSPEFSVLGNHYQLVPVKHTPGKPAFGLQINDDVFYSTDTIAIPDVIASLDFHTCFHDVTLSSKNPVHATLGSLIEQYPENTRKKMYLMSYEDHWREQESTVNSLLLDETSQIHFVYWHELQRHQVLSLKKDEELLATTQSQNNENCRGLQVLSCTVQTTRELHYPDIISGATVTQQDFETQLTGSQHTPLIYLNCTFNDIELKNLQCTRQIALISCNFEENFRLINCEIKADLWLCNSKFNKHFSLKLCKIDGNVHLEGADFTGAGGASFRGMSARNLYLDLGISGGRDLFWLNELYVPGVISIAPQFPAESKLMACSSQKTSLSRIQNCADLKW
jgi:hypothetical protein